MKFTPSEQQTIEKAIREAETHTSGEIVVHYNERCGSYFWIPWAAAFGALLGVGLWSWIRPFGAGWVLTPLHILEAQVAAAAAAFLFTAWTPILRHLVPASEKRAQVHRSALARFVLSGVSATRDRTGILVFLSGFEHQVEIVADEAIHKKCGTGYWDAQVKAIADGIRNGRRAEAVAAAVVEMGARLKEGFPRAADDQNELPDRPTSED